MKIRIFAQLALATGLMLFGAARASTTMYSINGGGGISGYNTATGAQLFSTGGMGLHPTHGNLSYGPDGYLYANSGGQGAPLFKINSSTGQIMNAFGGSGSGEFVFGSNTLYAINGGGGISGYNTATGAQLFSTGGMGLDPTFGNLSFGPDGYLYANSGGQVAPLFKINSSTGQVMNGFGNSFSSGEFVFGGNTLYTINGGGGISGYNTTTGIQVFGTGGMGLNPTFGNLSFGPDGYLYANGGGQGAPIFKINSSTGQVMNAIGSSYSGEFDFGGNTLYAINGGGGISGYNTATGAQLFSTWGLGLNPTWGNLSFGPDGYLYANSGGGSTPMLKINSSTGQVMNVFGNSYSSGEFVFATTVPEADTWTMLLAGIGVVGVAVRRRKQAEA